MKIIDLLNKIANGEEVPKKVKYNGVIFENEDGDLLNDIDCSLFEHNGNGYEKLLPMLNDEVEILEEEKKIPEKFDNYEINSKLHTSIKCEQLRQYFEMLCESYNQLLDYLKSKGE